LHIGGLRVSRQFDAERSTSEWAVIRTERRESASTIR
jgi:hypothetical protein